MKRATYLGVSRTVKSKILLCEAALSRLDCLVGLHTEAANHCRYVGRGDVDAEDSDSMMLFGKTTWRLVMALMFAGVSRAAVGCESLNCGAFPSILYKRTERHLSWRTTRLPANGRYGAACGLIFKDSYPPPAPVTWYTPTRPATSHSCCRFSA